MFTGAILLAPLVLVPLLWGALDRLIPRRVDGLKERLVHGQESGEMLLVAHDRLDQLKATGGRWSLVGLGGVLSVALGVAGIQYTSGFMLALSAACWFLPVARLARMSVEEGEVSYLKRALLELGARPQSDEEALLDR